LRVRKTSRGSNPQYASEITAGAKESFLDGADWAYGAEIVAILPGATVVFFLFAKREDEERLLARYHAEDTGAMPDRDQAPAAAQPAGG
jgi:hypothetical protein